MLIYSYMKNMFHISKQVLNMPENSLTAFSVYFR